MEAIQLRNDFHRLIDNFSDVKMLEQLYEAISDFQTRKTGVDILDELTKDQEVRLNASIEQAEKGKTVSHDEVKGKVKDWLTK